MFQAAQPPLGRADQIGNRRIGLPHLVKHGFGRNATVHHPNAPRLAVLALDAAEKVAQRGAVGGIAGQDLVGQRQPLGRHHQRNDHLHAVRSVVARVAEATLVLVRKRRLGLEVGAGQVVQQHVEGGVEQIPPPPHKMIEHRLLVRQQPVVATVQFVTVRERCVRPQQIRQGAASVPLPMQSPFCPRCDQPVRHQHEQHLIPQRALAAGRKSFGPKAIKPKLLPQLQSQPARSPLSWPAQPQLRQLEPHDGSVRQHTFAAIFRKQRQGPRSVAAVFQHLDRLAPSQLLRGVDLPQIQHVPLNHPPATYALVLDKAPVAVLLPVLLANRRAQKHGDRQVTPEHLR